MKNKHYLLKLPGDIHKKVKSAAALQGQTIEKFINESIIEKLSK